MEKLLFSLFISTSVYPCTSCHPRLCSSTFAFIWKKEEIFISPQVVQIKILKQVLCCPGSQISPVQVPQLLGSVHKQLLSALALAGWRMQYTGYLVMKTHKEDYKNKSYSYCGDCYSFVFSRFLLPFKRNCRWT